MCVYCLHQRHCIIMSPIYAFISRSSNTLYKSKKYLIMDNIKPCLNLIKWDKRSRISSCSPQWPTSYYRHQSDGGQCSPPDRVIAYPRYRRSPQSDNLSISVSVLLSKAEHISVNWHSEEMLIKLCIFYEFPKLCNQQKDKQTKIAMGSPKLLSKHLAFLENIDTNNL